MENITLGEIASIVAFVAALITGLTVILKLGSKWLTSWHLSAMKPVMDKLGGIGDRLDDVEFEICKNYIVGFLEKVETGDKLTNDTLERFWENYERYTKLGGNSYIHEWVKRLESEGKLYLPHI